MFFKRKLCAFGVLMYLFSFLMICVGVSTAAVNGTTVNAEGPEHEAYIREHSPEIHRSGFYDYYFLDDGTICFAGCSINNKNLVIPSEIDGKKVTAVGDGAFSEDNNIISVTFPDSITSIGKNAFSECLNITSIELPDNVVSIGDSAFYGCINLISVTVPDSVYDIGFSAFDDTAWLGRQKDEDIYIGKVYYKYNKPYNAAEIFSVDIKSGTKGIAGGAFFSKDNINEVNIPDGLICISNSAFYSCSFLESIVIPESVEEIGDGAFCWCGMLSDVIIPSKVKSIGDGAFLGCDALSSVTISEGVKTIGARVFSECKALTCVDIPDSVISVGTELFGNCEKLAEVHISDNMTDISDDMFSGCTSLSSVVIPEGITNIGSKSFSGCTSLSSVSIPDSIQNIGASAFESCTNLTVLSIPETIREMGEKAFYKCEKISKVEYKGSEKSFSKIKMSDETRIQLLQNIKYFKNDEISLQEISGTNNKITEASLIMQQQESKISSEVYDGKEPDISNNIGNPEIIIIASVLSAVIGAGAVIVFNKLRHRS